MAIEGTAAEKRASLVASRPLWSNMEVSPSVSSLTQGRDRAGDRTQDSVREWLTTVNEVDTKPEQSRQAAESLKRNASGEDDLALGVEASLYGKHGVRTVQEFLRSIRPDLSRWNSVTSALSTQSSPLSVMDVLNLWKDDPEEVLFDLGFGSDEPDLSGRIPARFINHQSHARGINIQVLLEAQKNRLDIENPDVSNRFRQLEVLQQVTTAFSTLVGGPAPSASPHAGEPSPGRDLSAEARERRRRMGMLFRKASRRSLGQTQTFQEQPPASSPSDQPEQPPSSIADKPATLRRTRLVLQESICLSPLVEEQGTLLDSLEAPTVEARLGLGKETQVVTSSAALAKKRSPGQARESFEMEEIQSFDDGSIAGSYSGTGDNSAQTVMRTNSCQSDSSGFLEEPFIPSLHSLQLSPGPGPGPEHGPWPRYGPWPASEAGLGSGPGPGLQSGSVHGIGTVHLKALSGGSTDSQVTVKEASLDRSCPASPSPPPSPTAVSSPTSLSNLPSPSSPTFLSHLPSPFSPTSLSNHPSPASPTSLSNLPSPISLSNLPSPSSPPSPSSSSHFPLFTSRIPNPSSPVFPSSLPFSASSAYDISATPLFSPTSAACYSIYPSSPYPSSPTSPSRLSTSLPGSASPLERPASPVDRQDSPIERPVSPLKTPDSVLERPVAPFERPNLLFERPDSTLERPDSSGRTPGERDGISDTTMGTAPSLMEDVFSAEDGKFSDCGISCHNNPDSSFRDVRKRDTDHFTLGAAGSREGEEEGESEKAGERKGEKEGVNDGAMEGEREGENEGAMEGENEGEREGENEGKGEGENEVATEGEREGENEGAMEGEMERENERVMEGEMERENEGEREGENEGVMEEGMEREREGENKRGMVGVREGEREGENEGQMEEEIEGESDGADADTVQTENVDCNLGMECSGTAGDPVLLDQGETDCLGLIEIEALESVFGCSAEVLEAVGEDEEKDCVCEEDDRDKPVCVSESKVSAEPSSLSSPVHVELHRFESLGRSTFSIVPPLAPAPIPIPASTPSPADLQRGAFQSKRSVSVQMPSSLSSSSLSTSLVSHDNALRPLPQSHLPDRRISLSKRPRSDADSYDVKGSDSTPVVMETNAATLPECPSFPPSPPRWRSRYSSQRSGSFRATAASLDKGLCQGKEGEGGGEDEEVDVRWRGALRGGTGACCSCEHRCSCCAHNSWQKQPSTFPYSVDELEGMMRCLKKFCSVLTDMEERLSEDQASVYSSLSLTDREEVRDILELRNAVKQEAGELELQLTDLVHHYDDSFKMKMNRLLDEQSFLCSQLRLLPPAATPTPSHTSTRNVATQCCMLPCSPLTDISEPHLQSSGRTRDLDSRPPLPVLNSTDEGLDGSSTSKSDKLDFVGLLQKLKKSLRHSVNTDLLE